MTPASNTPEFFSEFIGQKQVGCIIGNESRSLVFEDGRALTIHFNGSFWIDSADVVRRIVSEKARLLERTERELAGIIRLAGVLQS